MSVASTKAVVNNSEGLLLPETMCQVRTGGKLYDAKVVSLRYIYVSAATTVYDACWSSVTSPNTMSLMYVGTKQEMESLERKECGERSGGQRKVFPAFTEET